jgi:hypothetical protein
LLLAELRVERFCALFGCGAGLAFSLDQLDGAGDTLFECRKIAAAESEIARRSVIVHFRLLGAGMFRDLGFQR